jgi:hypothetical protein
MRHLIVCKRKHLVKVCELIQTQFPEVLPSDDIVHYNQFNKIVGDANNVLTEKPHVIKWTVGIFIGGFTNKLHYFIREWSEHYVSESIIKFGYTKIDYVPSLIGSNRKKLNLKHKAQKNTSERWIF